MNADRAIQMLLRMGMQLLSRRAIDGAKTPKEKARAKKNVKTARQVQRVARMARRVGRM